MNGVMDMACSLTLETHVLLAAWPVQLWPDASLDMPFLETACNQTAFRKTRFWEMKLEGKPRSSQT